jgi:nanoRNase/pAp phosphatase (c-di-AMP/oligoRNAs hydrolase)
MSDFKTFADSLEKTIKKYKNILICIKGSPDPDAIAASFLLKIMCELFQTAATIDSPVPPSLPENMKIIKELQIPVQFKPVGDLVKSYDSYAVLDHPSVEIEMLTGMIPCAIHIDHHQETEMKIPVDSKIIIPQSGSTSSIMVLLLQVLQSRLKFRFKRYPQVATALYFGIRTDTDRFSHATKLDKKAMELIKPGLDENVVRKIDAMPVQPEFLKFLNLAIKNQVVENEWLISGLGFLAEKNRDMIAIIADFLVNSEDVSKVLVFAIIEKKKGLTLDASLRTREKRFDLNAFIKKITRHGGARAYKGAYQVDLDYFFSCPDRDLLWKLVNQTTMEILKKLGVTAEIPVLKKRVRGLKNKLLHLWKKYFPD